MSVCTASLRLLLCLRLTHADDTRAARQQPPTHPVTFFEDKLHARPLTEFLLINLRLSWSGFRKAARISTLRVIGLWTPGSALRSGSALRNGECERSRSMVFSICCCCFYSRHSRPTRKAGGGLSRRTRRNPERCSSAGRRTPRTRLAPFRLIGAAGRRAAIRRD